MFLYALDMWAVGCIFAELLTLKPLFQGAEVKGTPNHFQVLEGFHCGFPNGFYIIFLRCYHNGVLY